MNAPLIVEPDEERLSWLVDEFNAAVDPWDRIELIGEIRRIRSALIGRAGAGLVETRVRQTDAAPFISGDHRGTSATAFSLQREI